MKTFLWDTFWGLACFAVGAMCYGLSSPSPTPSPACQAASVATCDVLGDVVVVDGDTLRATIKAGRNVELPNERIRLTGYDAWESTRHRFGSRTTDEELAKGRLATAAIERLVQDAEVILLTDGPRDRHGRCTGRLRPIQGDGSVLVVEEWMREKGHHRGD